ncbi:MAG: FtsX-like permease family protein [Fimbriimonadales bacterium]
MDPRTAPLEAKELKNTDPPLWVAWHQALASIRVRFVRQVVTCLGVALGIAFFASIQLLREAQASSAEALDAARLKWLVATSLVMCLVGVTNSMLMSVAERYREIGTIKCLGASDGFIVKVFCIEAALLGLIGSVGGSLLGAGLMSVVLAIDGTAAGWAGFFKVVGLGTLIGVLMTIVAAIAPAIQAARMPAAAALRVEV